MQNISANNNQAVIDIAVQHAGSAQAIVDVCVDNNISATDNIANGQQLLISKTRNKNVVNYLKSENIKPASDAAETPAGIGVWALDVDFKIS